MRTLPLIVPDSQMLVIVPSEKKQLLNYLQQQQFMSRYIYQEDCQSAAYMSEIAAITLTMSQKITNFETSEPLINFLTAWRKIAQFIQDWTKHYGVVRTMCKKCQGILDESQVLKFILESIKGISNVNFQHWGLLTIEAYNEKLKTIFDGCYLKMIETCRNWTHKEEHWEQRNEKRAKDIIMQLKNHYKIGPSKAQTVKKQQAPKQRSHYSHSGIEGRKKRKIHDDDQ